MVRKLSSQTHHKFANLILRYNPIQRYGPQDCVASVNGIISKIDKLTDSQNTKAIQELKAIFGLEKLKDIRDFAMTIAFPSKFSFQSDKILLIIFQSRRAIQLPYIHLARVKLVPGLQSRRFLQLLQQRH